MKRMSTGIWLVRIGAVATIAWIVFLIWGLFSLAIGAENWTDHRDRSVLCALVHSKAYALFVGGGNYDAAYEAATVAGAWLLIASDYPEDAGRVEEIAGMVDEMDPHHLVTTMEYFCEPSPLGRFR